MAATASYATDHHWDEPSHSRRCSIESVYSVQGRETDFARDTSDTEALASDDESGVEYEPVTESEGEAPIDDNTSAASDDEIIQTKVVEVLVGNDKDVQFADSEREDTYETDSEYDVKIHAMDFRRCVRCHNTNDNPVVSYCQKCYHIRKSFFPPMPKRKRRGTKSTKSESSSITRAASQEFPSSQASSSGYSTRPSPLSDIEPATHDVTSLKRRADSQERVPRKKQRRIRRTPAPDSSQSDSCTDDSEQPVQPLIKTVSDPFITIDPAVKFTKKSIANTVLETINSKDLCVVCVSEPKSGIFVHGRIGHICCCYKCAVKVWTKAKRCPLCNCKVSNVIRAVVM